MEHQGYISLVPTIVVVLLAICTRRTFESLLAGVAVGCLLLAPSAPLGDFTGKLLEVMRDDAIGWIILVCGLFGSLTYLLVASGGANAFAKWLLRFVKGRRSALLVTWLLGLVLFIDDYLNALTIGSTMKPITDRFRISREMLAYIVDSTAAPVCVLLPFSTWAIYVAGLFETNGVAPEGAGLSLYIQTIPYVVYGWVAIALVPSVALGFVPPLGPMKVAEERASTGETVPPNSDAISMEFPTPDAQAQPKLYQFVLPILLLIGATIWLDVDALKGVICAVAFTVLLYGATRTTSFSEAIDQVFAGFKTMIYPLSIIVMSFVLKTVNDQLGLTEFVIESVSPWLSRTMMPAICFVMLSFITFATGSFWGVYAISLPIIIPLARELGVPMPLALGAVVSSGAFGSHACFYGDATILSASATGCNNMAHVTTQLPYALLAGGISALTYLGLGMSV